jgi:DNA replication and repair protein RecF
VPLTRLRIRQFRNLGSQELEIPEEGVAVVGPNAQGKSNFLEAIYYLETLRSFRGAREEQLLGFGEEVFRLEGELSGSDDADTVSAAFQRRGKIKKVTVDGAEVDRMADGIGHLGAVIFSPLDTALVNSGPSERRRYLDIVLSLNRPGYLGHLQGYRKILGQRNAALKLGEGDALVRAWDDAMIREGAAVARERSAWCWEVGESFTHYYRQVSGGRAAYMRYRPSAGPVGSAGAEPGADRPADAEVWEDAFRTALAETADRERRQGTTVVGPHRDEVKLSLDDAEDGLELREFGSGGQRRTAALALRLVEADTIRRARGREPLVLMDDAFAELDEARSERVLELLEAEEKGQVILTAPKEADVRFRRDRMVRWSIDDGRIECS